MWIENRQDAAWLQARQRQLGRVPKRLYGSLDAAKARIEPRCPEEKAQRSEAFRARNLRYYCDLMEAKQLGQLVWATGCRVMAYQVPELAFVCDGAVWIWNLVSQYYPQAVHIVDWYHATEHLEKFASLAFPQADERQARLAASKEALRNGEVQAVIRACQQLADRCPKVGREISYFVNNEQPMDYAQWTTVGAVQTAKARATWLSGEWDSLPLAF